MQFDSALRLSPPADVKGYVTSPEDRHTSWTVGLFHNEQLVGMQTADDLVDASFNLPGMTQPCGFEFTINVSSLRKTDRLEVRVVNTDHVIGRFGPQDLLQQKHPVEKLDRDVGIVRHVLGLTLAGHLSDEVTGASSYEILAMYNDKIVGRTRVDRWRHIGDPTSPLGRRASFDLLLDADLADGETKLISVCTDEGVPLKGSPVRVLAYPNSFRDACQGLLHDTRSRFADMAMDRLLENSAPLISYGHHYPPLLKPGMSRKRLQSFGENGAYLASQSGEYVFVFHRGMSLRQDVETLLDGVDAPLVYFDFALRAGPDLAPILQPAFDYERFLEQGYAAYAFAVAHDLFETAMAASPASPPELFLRLLETGDTSERITHCPHPLGVIDPADIGDWMEGMPVVLEGSSLEEFSNIELTPVKTSTFPAIHVARKSDDHKVSIVIPTKDQAGLLRECVATLTEQNQDYDLDIVVVDNNSSEADALELLDELEDFGATILEFKEGFNFSVINNLAVEHARHEQLCFLNNDIEFFEPGVLRELCGRMAGPNVGAVGPKMVRGSDIIQHGGVTLGPFHGACHAFEDRMINDPGYGDLLTVAREVSAVTGAMLMTRRSLFEDIGGFDELRFPVNFNDVDYCLRLREAGHRVIFTPHATIRHFESVSRGNEINSPSHTRMEREVHNLRTQWRDVVLNDPSYHPLFSVDTMPYRALCTVHRSAEPRCNRVVRSSTLPIGF